MVKVILAAAALILGGSNAWAYVTKDDLKTLLSAGIHEPVIESYVRANLPVQPLTADDLVELRKMGASDSLLGMLVSGEAQTAGQAVAPGPEGYSDYSDYAQATAYPTYNYVYYDPYYYYPYFSCFPLFFYPFCSPFFATPFFFSAHCHFFHTHPFFFHDHFVVHGAGFHSHVFVGSHAHVIAPHSAFNTHFGTHSGVIHSQGVIQHPSMGSSVPHGGVIMHGNSGGWGGGGWHGGGGGGGGGGHHGR